MDRKGFKKNVSVDEKRKGREQQTAAIRKDKKEEGLAKRRNLMTQNFVQEEQSLVPGADVSFDQHKDVSSLGKAPKVTDIPQLMTGLNSPDVEVQITSLRGFRRLLSAERNPPVQECIDCGAVPKFVEMLTRVDSRDLQFEAAWALTNIASTDRTRLVVEYNAVPYLTQLLAHNDPEIREQCGWCLGNIAGDGAELRDIVLGNGALMPLVANIAQPANISLLRNLTWSLSNFCRGKPQPPLATIAPALPALRSIIMQSQDQETIVDATWALSYISDGDNARIQSVVDLGVIPVLVRMLGNTLPQAVVPALRTLGNIVSGNDSQTQAVVDSGVLSAIVPVLSHQKKNIRKEACWMLSNIAAGSINQITQLISTPELLPKVLQQLSLTTEWDVRKEAAWVVSNIATGGKAAHVAHLVEHGAIQPLCDLLDVNEVRIVLLAMEAMEAILKQGGDISDYTRLIDEAGGVDKLENLQEHENTEIYEKAVKIIETYFGTEEDENATENVAPVVFGNTFGGSNTFSFGDPAKGFGGQQIAQVPFGQSGQQAAPSFGQSAPRFAF